MDRFSETAEISLRDVHRRFDAYLEVIRDFVYGRNRLQPELDGDVDATFV